MYIRDVIRYRNNSGEFQKLIMNPTTSKSDTFQSAKVVSNKKENMFSFYIVALYLFLEFGRPQNLVPGLGSLRLPALTIVIIIISLLYTGRLNLKDKQTRIFMLILSLMILHGPIAINNYWAFWVFYGMAINFIAYLGISTFVDNEYKYDKFVNIYLYIFIYLSFYNFINLGRGVGGFLGDENDFCMVINMVFPFALYRVFTARNTSGKIYYISLSALFILANITTLSRGGFLGLAAVVGYCGVRSKNKMALGAILVLLVMFVLAFAPESYWDEVRSIFGESGNPYGTGAQRLYAWKLGWNMFLDNPILGVGQGNYPWHVVDVENQLGVQWIQRSLGGRVAHSLYFTLLPELGLIGVILYGLLIRNFFKDVKYIKTISASYGNVLSSFDSRNQLNNTLAFEASMIGFLVSSIFISTLYYPSLYILCAMLLAYKKILQTRVADYESSSKQADENESRLSHQ